MDTKSKFPIPSKEDVNKFTSAFPIPTEEEKAQFSKTTPSDVGYGESLLRGGAQGLTFGTADELTAALASPTGAFKQVANILGADLQGEDLDKYKKQLEESRAAYKAAEEANPMTSIAGNILGGLAPSVAALIGTGGAAAPALATEIGGTAKGLQALSNVQKAALVGGLEGAGYGLGQSEQESLGGLAKDVGVGGVLGGATGAVAGKLGRYLMGNEDEIARGVLEGVPESKGAIQKFAGSKLGQLYSGAFKGAKEGIDTTSEAANKLRELERGVLGSKVAKEVRESTGALGKEIGEKVEEAGKLKIPEYQSMMESLPKSIQEEQIKTIPAKYGKVSNAPKTLIKSLQEDQEKLTKLINEDPGVVSDIFRKRAATTLQNELPYATEEKEIANQIRKQLAEDPNQLIEDLTKATTTGEVSQDLQSLQENLKIKSNLGKLTKAAIEEKQASPNTILAKDLLDKIQGTKKEIAAAGTREFLETPEQTVKTLVDKIDTSHIRPHDVPEAFKLKDIITKHVNPDGSIDPKDTLLIRDKLKKLIPKMENDDLKQIAEDLADQVSTFRRKAAGEELYGKFSTAKSQMEQLGLGKLTTSANKPKPEEYLLNKKVGPEFAKKLKLSETPAKEGAAELAQTIKELQELHKNPNIDEAVKKMKESALYSRIYELKSGSSGSMAPDMIKRLLILSPAELAGEFSTTGVAKTTATVGKALYNMPSAPLKMIAQKLETSSPKASKLMQELANTTDEAKKRAILNMLNQMPQFRQMLKSIAGINEE